MRRSQVWFVFGAVGLAVSLLGEGMAFAQAKGGKKDGSIEEMTFEDDKLLTSNLGPDQAKITTRGGPVRTILVRPRTTFVPELLKSIENL